MFVLFYGTKAEEESLEACCRRRVCCVLFFARGDDDADVGAVKKKRVVSWRHVSSSEKDVSTPTNSIFAHDTFYLDLASFHQLSTHSYIFNV